MSSIPTQPGQQLLETLETEDGLTVFSAVHLLSDDQHHLRTLSEKWSGPTSATIVRDADEAPPILAAAESGLAVAKFAWDIIKEGKAVGKTTDAMSSVLSHADGDPLHYQDARVGKSLAYTWTLRDSLITSIEYVKIKLRVEGTYGARPAPGSTARPGTYLPDVYVNIMTCNVNFPCSASGSVNISSVSNVGHKQVDPMIRIHAKLTGGWFAQQRSITVGFIARGTNGFQLVGQEG